MNPQELRPFGVEVIEVVTGYVRSNLLHQGFFAPEDSLYLPIKSDVERIVSEGLQNGMPSDAYAAAVVERVLSPNTSPEIWDGKYAWTVELLARFTPLWFLVRIFTQATLLWRSPESFSLSVADIHAELVLDSVLQAGQAGFPVNEGMSRELLSGHHLFKYLLTKQLGEIPQPRRFAERQN